MSKKIKSVDAELYSQLVEVFTISTPVKAGGIGDFILRCNEWALEMREFQVKINLS